MLIDLPPHIEQAIISKAQSKGMTTENFVKEHLTQLANESKEDMLLVDFMKQFPPLEAFKDIDPVAYQREIRNEWD